LTDRFVRDHEFPIQTFKDFLILEYQRFALLSLRDIVLNRDEVRDRLAAGRDRCDTLVGRIERAVFTRVRHFSGPVISA
jgi:hypothetical protein